MNTRYEWINLIKKGNPQSSTVIINPETPPEIDYLYTATVTNEYDLNNLLRNLLANPQIRTVIPHSFQKPIKNALTNNVKNKTIQNTPYQIDSQITQNHLTTLQNRIELTTTHQNITQKPSKGTQIILPHQTHEPPRKYPTNHLTHTIQRKTYHQARNDTIDKLFRFGHYNKQQEQIILPNVTISFQTNNVEPIEPKDILHRHQTNTIDNTTKTTIYVHELNINQDLPHLLQDYKDTTDITIFIGKAYIPENDVQDLLTQLETPTTDIPKEDSIIIRKEHNLLRAIQINQDGKTIDIIDGTPQHIQETLIKQDKIKTTKQALHLGKELTEKNNPILPPIQKLLTLVEEKYQHDKQHDWSDGAPTYLDALNDEIQEVKNELNTNQQRLEDELSDILWDYLNILYNLEQDQKINLLNVFEHTATKYKERMNAVKKGISWHEIKNDQEERLSKSTQEENTQE